MRRFRPWLRGWLEVVGAMTLAVLASGFVVGVARLFVDERNSQPLPLWAFAFWVVGSVAFFVLITVVAIPRKTRRVGPVNIDDGSALPQS